MWIGLFLTVILGLLLLFLTYIFMDNCDFEFYMTQREFCLEILKDENIDNMYSKETTGKYEKYMKKMGQRQMVI